MIELVKSGAAILLIVLAVLLVSISEWLILWAGRLDSDLTQTMVGRLATEIRRKVL